MPDILIFGDTIRSPELRHEVPLPVPDPFLYVEHNGSRTVVISSLEIARIRELEGVEVIPHEEVGEHELIEQGVPREEIPIQASLRACQKLGATGARQPRTKAVRSQPAKPGRARADQVGRGHRHPV